MDEVKSLSVYARQRGVLLLPEFDGPGHAAYGWQKWPAEKGLGNMTTCMGPIWKDEVNTLAQEPPAGQLNPVNENLYEVITFSKQQLQRVYRQSLVKNTY